MNRLAVRNYVLLLVFTVNFGLTDGKTRRVGLYFLDWDRSDRTARVDILGESNESLLTTPIIFSSDVMDLQAADAAFYASRFYRVTPIK